jgi:tetratricopeptide (TPR) repeat protein
MGSPHWLVKQSSKMKNLSVKFLIGLILIVGFLVYLNALPNDFVWDDEEQIVHNLIIRSWRNLSLIFTSSTFYAGGAGLSGGFYRPLVTLSYILNYHLWGLNPFGFRLFQIAIHFANLILIFFVLKNIFSSRNIKYGKEIAGLTALLFAVHPANVESVAYLGSIGEVLYTFFILLAFLYFLKNKFYLGFFLSFFGLLSKETAIVIFPLFALYLFIFNRPKGNKTFSVAKKQKRASIKNTFKKIYSRYKIWFNYVFGSGLVIGTYLFLRFAVAKIPASSFHLSPISEAPLLERLKTIPYEIFSYLRIIFFPKTLSISHQFVVSSVFDIRFWGSLIFIILVLGLAVFYILKIRPSNPEKTKLILFFLFWFFISIAPALNIIPLEMTMAERWLYFPIIGILAWISLLVIPFVMNSSKIQSRIFTVFLILIIALFGRRTIIRTGDWKDGLTLFSHDIKYSKNNFDLENNYGVELFRIGKINEAEKHFKNSIKLQPNWVYPHNNLGAVMERKGNLNQALAEYKKAVALSDYYLAYENIGGVLIKMKKFNQAKEFLSKAILKFPRNANLKWQLALIYLNENNAQKGESLLWAALQDDPGNKKVIQILRALRSGEKIKL